MTIAESPAAAAKQPSDRAERGRFALGNPGGPGRPPKAIRIEREVITLIANALTDEDWEKMAQAVARKASEGNVSAMSLLMRTVLNGRLNAAAAAAEIGLPPEVEMYDLGCKLHPRWIDLLEAHRRAELLAAARAAAQTESPAPSGPAPQAVITPVAEVPERAAEAAESTAPKSQADEAAKSPAPSAQPRVVPAAERVQGFRVTKGPRPPENGRKRWNHAKTSPPATSKVG